MRASLFAAMMLLGFSAPAAAFAPDTSSWPMMRRDLYHNSTTTVSGLVTPKVSWIYHSGGLNSRSYMSVVLGSNGTIYAGGTTKLFALNQDGSVKWTANESPGGVDSWGTPIVGDNSRLYVSSPTAVYAYNTGGAGGITFVSSATAGTTGSLPGGGGAVVISTNGVVYVGHGDETFNPTLANTNNYIYAYNSSLAPLFSVSGAGSFQGRSALAFQDGGLVVYGASANGLPGFVAASGANAYVGNAGGTSLWDSKDPGVSIRGDMSYVSTERNFSSECPAQGFGLAHFAAFSKTGALVWRKCDIDLGNFSTLRYQTPISDSSLNTYITHNNTNTLYKIDNTGATLWSYAASASGISPIVNTIGPPTLVGSTTVYFTYCAAGGNSTRLVSVNAANGAGNWDVLISTTACLQGQPVPAPGNRVFVYNGEETIALEQSEAIAMTASSSPAVSFFSNLDNFWYSTVTVSVTKAGGLPVSSGVIVEVSSFKNNSAIGSPTITPGATNFLLTDTAGQVKFPVKYQFNAAAKAIDLVNPISTITFRSPGVADQTIFMKESRGATLTVSTQAPAYGGGAVPAVIFSTITFTVKDSLAAPVSGVPCMSNATPVSWPGSINITHYPTTPAEATTGSGQANIVFADDLTNLNNDNYAAYSVTHTVTCMGFPLQSIVMKEHRVNTVTISTGQAGVEVDGSGNYARVSTVTVTLRDSFGAVVPGVPVALDLSASPAPITIFPTAVAFTTATNSLGQVKFFVSEYLQGVDPAVYATMASTFTLRVLSYPDQTVVLREERVATVTVATGTAVMSGNNRLVVTTVTIRDASGALLPNIPVGINSANFGGITSYLPGGASIGRYYTNGVGVATFTASQLVLHATFPSFYGGYSGFSVFNSSLTISVPQRPDQSVGTRESRVASYSITVSSTSVDSDLRYATMTVTVRDALSNPVPNVPVAISSYTRPMLGASNILTMDPPLAGGSNLAGGSTDGAGQVKFTLRIPFLGAGADYDSFDDFIASVAVVPMNLPVTTSYFLVENNRLDHYVVSVPTVPVSVGVSFVSTITATNNYNHRVSSYTQSGINLVALFAGTNVQGTGSLGTNVTGTFTDGQFVISPQTYNKVEDIDIKASRSSDGKNGRSNSLTIRGPDHFIVTIPTAASAGVAFSMTITAVDAASTPVVGYAATISLSALKASNPSLAGAGTLGVTNVNMPANGTVTIANQTYTKAEGIMIRATDTGASVVGQSTYSAVVGAGTPAVITMLANPQSTIAGVPTVLTATIFDGFSNAVSNSTATFSVATGSGVVSLSLTNGSVVSAVTSTQAVTDSFGQATAFFSSTNSLSAQANVLRASLGALARDTTVYTTVLVTSAGGAVVNFANPQLRADVPANTYGFSVRLGIQSKSELSATDLAMTTAAFAATANTFVSTTVLKLSAVRDASPTVAAGTGSKFITVKMPYVVTSGSISVGAYGAQSILVPLSVMRVFKLNQTSSVFEQVLDGATAVDSLNGTISAEVSDPDGVYVLGAPAFTNLTTGSSATVTTALAGGTSAQVIVPQGGFSSPATISVTVPGAAAVPALPTRAGLTGTGITISVSAGGLQPTNPVTVKIGYRPIDVAGINPDYLRLARYDASTGWVVLDSSADSATRQVIGTTNHFSLFQIVAQAPGASVADAFVFPNPFRPALGHTNIKLSNLPAAAHVKIYTATGRLLKELDADAAGQVLTWNGTDRDGRALASGVYLAVIEGTGGRRTIKFAVQR